MKDAPATQYEQITIPSSTGSPIVLCMMKTENVPIGHSYSIGAYGVTEFCHDPECPQIRCILRRVHES